MADVVLLALLRKYQRVRELRRLHDECIEHDPRVELRALSLEFPGVLRELDQLPIEIIDARIAELESALSGGVVSTWMRWMAQYHGELRAALRIKRQVAAQQRGAHAASPIAHVWTQVRATYLPALDEPPLHALDDATLTAIAKPPLGRLSPWVIERIAAQHGVSVDEVRAQLFPNDWTRR